MRTVFAAAVALTALSALMNNNPGAALLLVAAAAWLAVRARSAARMVGSRKLAIRTEPGHEVKVAARHEGGHVALAKAAGGKVLGAEVYPDGSGVTWVRMPASATVVDEIAVCVAGEVAARTSRGCSSDQADVRAALATLPAGERDAARRAGYDRARSVVGGFLFDGGVSATAEKLLRDGRL
jgi:hypothetical protein